MRRAAASTGAAALLAVPTGSDVVARGTVNASAKVESNRTVGGLRPATSYEVTFVNAFDGFPLLDVYS